MRNATRFLAFLACMAAALAWFVCLAPVFAALPATWQGYEVGAFVALPGLLLFVLGFVCTSELGYAPDYPETQGFRDSEFFRT